MTKEYQALYNLKNKASETDRKEALDFLTSYIETNSKLLSRLGLIFEIANGKKKEVEDELFNLDKSMSPSKLIKLNDTLEELERLLRVLRLVSKQYDHAGLHGLKED